MDARPELIYGSFPAFTNFRRYEEIGICCLDFKLGLELIQLSVQMLPGKLVVGANHAALKKAPDAFNTVGVNVAPHLFFPRLYL